MNFCIKVSYEKVAVWCDFFHLIVAITTHLCYNKLSIYVQISEGVNGLIILGIDPGYAIVGWGVIEYAGITHRPVAFGAITTEAHTDFNARLKRIYDDTVELIQHAHPDAMAIEKLYFNTNTTTAIHVAQARGVILLAAEQAQIPVYEYTPLQVKTAVTGYGKALKPQVMEMTRRLLHLKEVPKPDDTADALAIAIAHTQAAGTDLREKMMKRGTQT